MQEAVSVDDHAYGARLGDLDQRGYSRLCAWAEGEGGGQRVRVEIGDDRQRPRVGDPAGDLDVRACAVLDHVLNVDHDILAGSGPERALAALPARQDPGRLVEHQRATRPALGQRALASFSPEEFRPGARYQSDEEPARVAGDIATTIFHPVGSTLMGRHAAPRAAREPHPEMVATQQVAGLAICRPSDRVSGASPVFLPACSRRPPNSLPGSRLPPGHTRCTPRPCFRGPTRLCASSPGEHTALSTGRALLARVPTIACAGRPATAPLRGGRVRCLPEVRAAGGGLPAAALRAVPGREAGDFQLQEAWLPPLARRQAHGRDGSAAGRWSAA